MLSALQRPRFLIALTVFLHLLSLTGCGPRSSDREQVTELRIHNLAPAFDEFYQREKTRPIDEQVAAFKREVIPLYPGFYQYKLGKMRKAGRDPDQQIRAYLSQYPFYREKFVKRAQSLPDELAASVTSFTQAFPDFRPNVDVYILHSLGELDGGTRTIDGKHAFLLGVDNIVALHGERDETPFFHHELFHLYHGQYFRGGDELYNALWIEGLATYVSLKLNPDASMAEILLDTPQNLIKACENRRESIIKGLRAQLDSREPADYERYFLLSSSDRDVPPRAGYYFGFLSARAMSESPSAPMPLPDLARLSGEPLRQALDHALGELLQSPAALTADAD